MSTTEPVLDPAPNPPSPKVWAVSLLMLLVPAVSAGLLYLQTDEGTALYATLPVLLVVAIRSLLAGLTAFLGGYMTVDPQRILDLATSPKVWAALGAGLLLQIVADLVTFLSGDGQTLYAHWPPVLVVMFSALLPAVGAWVAGYLVNDPARRTSANPVPVALKPPV